MPWVTSALPRNIEGVYPLSLAGQLGALHDRANELPDIVKVGMLLAAYTDKYYRGYFYFKAQNLRRRLRGLRCAACGIRRAAHADDAHDGVEDSAARRADGSTDPA